MSAFSILWQILPLLVALLLVAALAFVVYHVYLSLTKMGETASQRMGRKNVVFSRDGMRVGVKQVKDEKYLDKTQSYMVKAWNLGQQQQQQQTSQSKPKEGTKKRK